MKFLIFVFVLCCTSVTYGQFQTVPVDTLETIEIRSPILAQVDVCEYCSLVPISYSHEMVGSEMMGREKQKLFGGNREGGRLRGLISRLFGRDRRASRGGCGG